MIESNKEELTRFFGEEIGTSVSRARLKQYLMEYKIENLAPGEPFIDDPVLLEKIKEAHSKTRRREPKRTLFLRNSISQEHKTKSQVITFCVKTQNIAKGFGNVSASII